MADDTAAQAIRYAVQAGAKLNEAKSKWDRERDGNWTDHLNQFPGGAKVAQARMRVAKEFPKLADEKSMSGHTFSVLHRIAYAPDELKEDLKDKVNSGETMTRREVDDLIREHKEKVKSLQDKNKQLAASIDDKVNEKYKADFAHLDELNKQQTAAQSRIDHLLKQRDQLESKEGAQKREQAVLSKCRRDAMSIAIEAADVFQDTAQHPELFLLDGWEELADKLEETAEGLRQLIKQRRPGPREVVIDG